MKRKTIKQLEKKQAKKEKKIHSIVKKEFKERVKGQKKDSVLSDKKNNKKTNAIVNNIARSVILNKRMLDGEKDQLKKWQESYFQELYTEFKKLIEKYNNGLQVKGETLKEKISNLKIEKRRLQDDVRELEAKKKALINE